LASFPLGLVGGIAVVVGLGVGAATSIIWVGVPLLALTLLAAHGMTRANIGLLRMRRTYLTPLPFDRAQVSASVWRRLLAQIANPDRWREAGYLAIMGPLTAVSFALTICAWLHAVLGTTEWLWRGVMGVNQSVVDLFGQAIVGNPSLGGSHWVRLPAFVWDLVIGVFCVLVLPALTAALANCQALVTLYTATGSPRYHSRRLARLAESRSRAANAESQSLRRLERDLHDGPQQRLVRVGLDLAAAGRRLDDGDPATAASIVAGARRQTEAALADLRGLVRGLAPPVLADRGLVPALTAVAAASSIPATLSSEFAETVRFGEPVERAVYFAVSEAVANAAKHSGAARLAIGLALEGGLLIASVRDNGAGGAMILPGHGLAGLADRAAGVDGSLTVASEAGAGTTVVIAVPFA
jgi:signal transduction histidine kinase